MNYSYFPGCSLHGSSKSYDLSTRDVCKELGIDLQELPDWICCGASSGHSMDEVLEIGLPAKNLKIAEDLGKDIAVPCAACYNRLKGAQHAMINDPKSHDQMNKLLKYDFQNDVSVLNLVELIHDRVGLDTVRSKVTAPLTGLKVACYYGCLLVRPVEVTEFDDPEHPVTMDNIMEATGATSVDWSYKTECCGGSLSLTRDDICYTLVDEIINMAREAGADAVVTACPLCMENLEIRQTGMSFPVFFFTELLGLAFGMKNTPDWLEKHLIDTAPALQLSGINT